MQKTYTFRPEQENDYRTVEILTRDAFWDVFKPGCDEHYLLHNLRRHPDFVAELDYVALDGNDLVGHIAYSRARVDHPDGTQTPVLTFGPVSVRPDYQKQGVGSALIRFTLDKARSACFLGVIVCGWPDYYPRFGFLPARKAGITDPEGNSDEALQILEFVPGSLKPGVFHACEAFYALTPEGLKAFETGFEPREKHILPTQLFK